jgi:hypothetical protein
MNHGGYNTRLRPALHVDIAMRCRPTPNRCLRCNLPGLLGSLLWYRPWALPVPVSDFVLLGSPAFRL